jgi:hypothetical protein
MISSFLIFSYKKYITTKKRIIKEQTACHGWNTGALGKNIPQSPLISRVFIVESRYFPYHIFMTVSRGEPSLRRAVTKRIKIKTADVIVRKVTWFLYLPVVAFFVVLLLSLVFFPSFAASEIYKWKDNDGNVIFSDSPPPRSNAEEVRLKNNMRIEKPPLKEDDESKTGKRNKAATRKRLRDASEINVVMYMTDW